MPHHYARRLLAIERTEAGNAHLGWMLAFIAGAINAGGFLAVHQYTSHMTGLVSSAADALVLGQTATVLTGIGALLSFTAGAACTALLVNLGHARQARSAFALPLLLEAACLLAFGLMGAQLTSHHALFIPLAVMLLCFTMGLQNALITKISGSVIRTTHVTGIVTDIGIELGRTLAGVGARGGKLRLLGGLLLAFAGGGVTGAWAFQALGYLATLPLAALLTLLGAVPAWDDLRSR